MLDQGGNFYFRVRRTKVLAQNDFILYFFDALFAQENFALEVIISSLTRQVFFKVIHPKYYKHLKKGAHQSHLGRQKWAGFWQISLYIVRSGAPALSRGSPINLKI